MRIAFAFGIRQRLSIGLWLLSSLHAPRPLHRVPWPKARHFELHCALSRRIALARQSAFAEVYAWCAVDGVERKEAFGCLPDSISKEESLRSGKKNIELLKGAGGRAISAPFQAMQQPPVERCNRVRRVRWF